MKNELMDLNKETAMRLWNKNFGKDTRVTDFAGRTIDKGAYNDRESKYGWNVDHIQPQSRGGKTAEHNLIICHIKTNDEKADKFPAFKANGKNFEIIRVQNHYEIRPHKKNEVKKDTSKSKTEDEVNFFDHASGLRLFKKLKGCQNRKRWVGSVRIRLKNLINTAVLEFIEEIFDEEQLSFSFVSPREFNYYVFNSRCPDAISDIRVVAVNFEVCSVEKISKLLDKCLLLNTYIKNYFIPMGYCEQYDIGYQVRCFENNKEFFEQTKAVNFEEFRDGYQNCLYINKLVYINTETQNDEPDLSFGSNYFEKFDYTFTNLSNNLKKEAGK